MNFNIFSYKFCHIIKERVLNIGNRAYVVVYVCCLDTV